MCSLFVTTTFVGNCSGRFSWNRVEGKPVVPGEGNDPRFNFDLEFPLKSSRVSCVPPRGIRRRRRIKSGSGATRRAHFPIPRERDNAGRVIKEPGEEEEQRITHASDKASCRRHRSQRSRLLYLYCPQTLLSISSPPPPPRRCLRSSRFGSGFRIASTRAGTTKGVSQRQEREMYDERELFATERHVTSSVTL